MNILTSCNYSNCYQQFKSVYDNVSHYETKHLPEMDWKRVHDIDELEKNLETADPREKERIQEHLNTVYNQPLRMSLFYKLDPYPPGHIVNPQEKKPLTLQFTNYRKRPAPNPPTVNVHTPKKSINKSINGDLNVADHSVDERKYHCKVEGCTKSYKNSAGLRSHMRSVHNANSQQTRTSVSPSPNYATNAHISYQPSNQNYYGQKVDESKTVDSTGHPAAAGSIGSLAMFNASTSRLHGSEDGFTQPQANSGANYRAGSRLTPSEENILNRNLTTLSAAPPRSTTPSNALQSAGRAQDGKFKCEYCPKTYKTNSNLQKHINDNHRQQINLDNANTQRPVLSKNVLRTYSISGNQVGQSLAQQPQQPSISSVQQAKNTLLSAKTNIQPGARSPASPSMHSNSPNVSPAPHISVQPPARNQPNIQQRTYVQTRTYAPVQSQAQNQPIYHFQQVQQQSGDTPQSLDIQIPQSQSSSSPQNYGSSPVTVVLQSQQQQQASPNVQTQNEHYQPTGQAPNVRPGARTFTSQQYYERYQNTLQQRRPANKAYTATGNYAYQPKQVKQVYRQPVDYPRGPTAGSINRVNTVSSTGQPVRITSLNSQSGAPISSMMNTSHLSAGNSSMIGNNSSGAMPTTYQVRTNFDNSRHSPQVQSNSLSSQLTPLNVNYGGNTTTTTTSLDDGPRIRASSNAIRGRLSDNVRGGHSGVYNQAMPPRYGGQMPQYTQRIMRVIPNSGNNPALLQQQQQHEQGSQRSHQSHNPSDS